MVDDPSFHQWELGLLEEFTNPDLWNDIQPTLPSECLINVHDPVPSITSTTFSRGSSMESSHAERPKRVAKTAVAPSTISSSPSILSFGNPDSPDELYKSVVAPKLEREVLARSKRSIDDGVTKKKAAAAPTTRAPPHNLEHIIAERKRREKISQRFIALSAIVPGLKKMDKASVLGDTIRYLKQLQEKVKALEEQQSAQKPVGSPVVVRNSRATDVSISDKSFDARAEDRPEIEARLSEKTVLVNIHCENRKGLLVKVLVEIESANLSLLNTTTVPFGATFIDITVVAQIEEGFSCTKDLVNKLNAVCRQFK